MNYKRLFIPNALVFLTIVTNNRISILLNNLDILQESFFNTMKIYKYHLIAYTIQTDHLHCIIKPKEITDYSKIVKSFKYSFTKKYKMKNNNNQNIVGRHYHANKKIWQNRFWEHTIRSEEDLNKHLDYIHYNSVKHNNITPNDWEYSSFMRFVSKGLYDNDWCNIGDKHNINSLDYE